MADQKTTEKPRAAGTYVLTTPWFDGRVLHRKGAKVNLKEGQGPKKGCVPAQEAATENDAPISSASKDKATGKVKK